MEYTIIADTLMIELKGDVVLDTPAARRSNIIDAFSSIAEKLENGFYSADSNGFYSADSIVLNLRGVQRFGYWGTGRIKSFIRRIDIPVLIITGNGRKAMFAELETELSCLEKNTIILENLGALTESEK